MYRTFITIDGQRGALCAVKAEVRDNRGVVERMHGPDVRLYELSLANYTLDFTAVRNRWLLNALRMAFFTDRRLRMTVIECRPLRPVVCRGEWIITSVSSDVEIDFANCRNPHAWRRSRFFSVGCAAAGEVRVWAA